MQHALDLQVSRVAFAVKLLEKALHDPGPWEMAWGPFTVPAQREVGAAGVTLRADYPSHCFMGTPANVVALLCNGEVVAVRSFEDLGDGDFEIEWRLAARMAVAA